MEQAVLTSDQKKIISLVANEKQLSPFYLTGGTALAAYYFYHRFSDDLDFFIFKDPDIVFLRSFAEKIKKLIGAKDIRFSRLYDRNQFYFDTDDGELKIEFTKYPFNQLEEPQKKEGMRVDSLKDLSANKLMAMLDRFDPKDFVDLFFILHDRKLVEVKSDAEKKFDMKIDKIFLGSEIAKAKRIEALPKMIKPLTLDALKIFFTDQAKSLGKEIFT